LTATATGTQSDRPRRFAFLTPEYPTELRGEGGVSSYVHKMAHLLASRGHDCTVFVVSREPGTLWDGPVKVVRVPRSRALPVRALTWVLRRFDPFGGYVVSQVATARLLAAALEAEHAMAPFDVVQSANLQVVGLYVRRREGRRHLVRISTSRLLYDASYSRGATVLSRVLELLDVRAQRRADVTYAPSAFLQRYFSERYGLPVKVVRPPMPTDVSTRAAPPPGLPERYLVHYGMLGRRKGSDVIAEALPLAWERAPDLRMVWAGPLRESALKRYSANWGERVDQVTYLGPLDKPVLYGVVAGAVASVLPSRMDNLPNTVIESLSLGVPVIGSDGASIDELVAHGRSGLLVPIGDAAALADAMVAVWQGRSFECVAPPDEMDPDRAVAALLEVAGVAPGTRLV